jgi:hypothetical protein
VTSQPASSPEEAKAAGHAAAGEPELQVAAAPANELAAGEGAAPEETAKPDDTAKGASLPQTASGSSDPAAGEGASPAEEGKPGDAKEAAAASSSASTAAGSSASNVLAGMINLHAAIFISIKFVSDKQFTGWGQYSSNVSCPAFCA